MEVNPRKARGVSVFTQTLIAVLSGAAAMYAIQNVKTGPSLIPVLRMEPPPPKPVAAPPSPGRERSRLAAPKKAQPGKERPRSSMLVEAEPGGAPAGMLHAFGDDPEGGTRARPTWRDPGSPGKEGNRVIINPGDGYVREFDRIRWRGADYYKRHPRPARAEPGEPAPKVKTAPILFDKKPLPAKDEYTAPMTDPLAAKEVFWTQDRLLRVGGAASISIVGFLYLLFGSGLFGVLKDKKETPEKV